MVLVKIKSSSLEQEKITAITSNTKIFFINRETEIFLFYFFWLSENFEVGTLLFNSNVAFLGLCSLELEIT